VEHRSDVAWHNQESIWEDRSGTGGLINPLLECEVSTYGNNQKYIPFESEVKKQIMTEVVWKNPDLHVSVYFRNLRNGPWFGIGENAEFSPASLMKLPVTMAYAKWSESVQDVFSRSLTGILETSSSQNTVVENLIEPGKPYSVDELIQHSLVNSDNNANLTLLKNIPIDMLLRVFRELNIPVIDEISAWKEEFITVKEYASFFRILYNASYLSREKSLYLLEIMTHSSMMDGIRWSIPLDIAVAHKFWERRIRWDEGTYVSQYHDCGIIYYEQYPYILCIMTKGGDDISRLENIVEQVSTLIFEVIRERY
jgi:beta-lactamase class A